MTAGSLVKPIESGTVALLATTYAYNTVASVEHGHVIRGLSVKGKTW